MKFLELNFSKNPIRKYDTPTNPEELKNSWQVLGQNYDFLQVCTYKSLDEVASATQSTNTVVGINNSGMLLIIEDEITDNILTKITRPGDNRILYIAKFLLSPTACDRGEDYNSILNTTTKLKDLIHNKIEGIQGSGMASAREYVICKTISIHDLVLLVILGDDTINLHSLLATMQTLRETTMDSLIDKNNDPAGHALTSLVDMITLSPEFTGKGDLFNNLELRTRIAVDAGHEKTVHSKYNVSNKFFGVGPHTVQFEYQGDGLVKDFLSSYRDVDFLSANIVSTATRIIYKLNNNKSTSTPNGDGPENQRIWNIKKDVINDLKRIMSIVKESSSTGTDSTNKTDEDNITDEDNKTDEEWCTADELSLCVIIGSSGEIQYEMCFQRLLDVMQEKEIPMAEQEQGSNSFSDYLNAVQKKEISSLLQVFHNAFYSYEQATAVRDLVPFMDKLALFISKVVRWKNVIGKNIETNYQEYKSYDLEDFNEDVERLIDRMYRALRNRLEYRTYSPEPTVPRTLGHGATKLIGVYTTMMWLCGRMLVDPKKSNESRGWSWPVILSLSGGSIFQPELRFVQCLHETAELRYIQSGIKASSVSVYAWLRKTINKQILSVYEYSTDSISSFSVSIVGFCSKTGVLSLISRNGGLSRMQLCCLEIANPDGQKSVVFLEKKHRRSLMYVESTSDKEMYIVTGKDHDKLINCLGRSSETHVVDARVYSPKYLEIETYLDDLSVQYENEHHYTTDKIFISEASIEQLVTNWISYIGDSLIYYSKDARSRTSNNGASLFPPIDSLNLKMAIDGIIGYRKTLELLCDEIIPDFWTTIALKNLLPPHILLDSINLYWSYHLLSRGSRGSWLRDYQFHVTRWLIQVSVVNKNFSDSQDCILGYINTRLNLVGGRPDPVINVIVNGLNTVVWLSCHLCQSYFRVFSLYSDSIY